MAKYRCRIGVGLGIAVAAHIYLSVNSTFAASFSRIYLDGYCTVHKRYKGGPPCTDCGSELKALYSKMQNAVKKRDIKVVAACVSDNFKGNASGSAYGKKDLLKMMNAQFEQKDPQYTYMEVKPTIIKQSGTEAVLNVTSKFEGKINAPNGKKHVLTAESKTEDTCERTSAGWQVKSSRTLSSKLLMDGKPYNPDDGASLPRKKK